MQFYDKETDFDYDGTYYLAGTNSSDLKGLFLYIYDGGTIKYFQREGVVNVTSYYEDYFFWIEFSITAHLSGVVLEEVTIDSDTNESAPVTGGKCLKIKDTTVEYEY